MGKMGIDLYDTLYLSAGTDGDMYLNHQLPKVHRNILDFAAIGQSNFSGSVVSHLMFP